jgi:hypothetical protein
MSEHSNRKKLLQESLLLSRKDWLELALALYAQRASAQGYTRTFELGDWNQLNCQVYMSAATQQQLQGQGFSGNDQLGPIFRSWYEREKKRVRELLTDDERLAPLADLADGMMMDVYRGYGDAAEMICRISAEGFSWSHERTTAFKAPVDPSAAKKG